MRFENGLFQLNPDFVRAPADVASNLAGAGELVIAGYATTYDRGIDNAIVTPEALKSAAEDLKARSTVLFNHDQNRPIGRVVDVKVDDKGLFVVVIIDKTEKEIQEKIKSGTLRKFSIRGRILSYREQWDPETETNVQVVDRLKLLEVSVVSVPVVAEAEIQHWYMSNAQFKELEKEERRMAEEKKDQELKRSEDQQVVEEEVERSEAVVDEISQEELERELEEVSEVEFDENELIEAITSNQLETLMEINEKVSAIDERLDEIARAASTSSIMKKLDEIADMVKKILEAVQKYPYPYPYPAPENKRGEEASEDHVESPLDEIKNSVSELKEELEEIKRSVVTAKGEKVEEVDNESSALAELVRSESYQKADPIEKLRMLWNVAVDRE